MQKAPGMLALRVRVCPSETDIKFCEDFSSTKDLISFFRTSSEIVLELLEPKTEICSPYWKTQNIYRCIFL